MEPSVQHAALSNPEFCTLRKRYRQLVLAKSLFISPACIEMLEDTVIQDAFITEVVNDVRLKMFPPPRSYVLRVLKQLMSVLEKKNMAVSESLVETYMTLMDESASTPDDEYFFQTFELPRQPSSSSPSSSSSVHLISIRVVRNFNVTGLVMWEAGYYLSEHVLARPERFRGKRIVELGAGVSLPGLVLSSLELPATLTLTDCIDSVLENMKYVFGSNELMKETLRIEHFNWERYEPEDLQRLAPADIYMAADVIYDASSLPSLSMALRQLLLRSPPSAYALFCVTRRNLKTLDSFLELLTKRGLTFRDEVDFERMECFEFEPSAVRVLVIELPELEREKPNFGVEVDESIISEVESSSN